MAHVHAEDVSAFLGCLFMFHREPTGDVMVDGCSYTLAVREWWCESGGSGTNTGTSHHACASGGARSHPTSRTTRAAADHRRRMGVGCCTGMPRLPQPPHVSSLFRRVLQHADHAPRFVLACVRTLMEQFNASRRGSRGSLLLSCKPSPAPHGTRVAADHVREETQCSSCSQPPHGSDTRPGGLRQVLRNADNHTGTPPCGSFVRHTDERGVGVRVALACALVYALRAFVELISPDTEVGRAPPLISAVHAFSVMRLDVTGCVSRLACCVRVWVRYEAQLEFLACWQELCARHCKCECSRVLVPQVLDHLRHLCHRTDHQVSAPGWFDPMFGTPFVAHDGITRCVNCPTDTACGT